MSDIATALQQYLREHAWAGDADVGKILNHVPDGLIVTDPASKILWANASYCRMAGYTLAELRGKSPRLLRSPSTEAGSIEALWESLNASGRAETPVVDIRADGTELHAWLSVVQVELEGQGSALYLGILRDISVELADRAYHHALARQAANARDVTIAAMAALAEQRDGTTGRHLERVEAYCLSMTRWLCRERPEALPLAARDPELVARCAILHDIGKVGIPDAILTKPGRLDSDEQEVMRRHPIIGAEIIERILLQQPDSDFLRLARDVVLYHHEAHDGSGYPFGIAGDEIPIAAQLTTLADVLDALTSERPYKAAHSLEESIHWIQERSGRLFAPVVVEALLAVRAEVEATHARLTDRGDRSSAPIARQQLGSSSLANLAEIAPSLTEARHAGAQHDVVAGDGLEAVLRAVVEARLTGEVRVPHGAHQARVDIADGEVLWVDGTGSDPTLQGRLVEAGIVSADDLERSVSECRRTGRRLVAVLLEAKRVERAALRAVILQHVAHKLRVLLDGDTRPGASFATRPCVRTTFAFGLSELLASANRDEGGHPHVESKKE